MTTIVLAPRLEDPTSDTEAIVGAGWKYRVRPSMTYEGAQWVLSAWPPDGGWKFFTGVSVNLLLDPMDSISYELQIEGLAAGIKGGKFVVQEFRLVKTSTSNGATWQSLERTLGQGAAGTYPASFESALAAAEANLQAQINAISVSGGGASTTDQITDMSADARTFNKASNNANMRTALSAAAATHTHGVTDLTATGTKDGTTFLRGDNTFAVPPAASAASSTAAGVVELATDAEAIAGTDTARAVTPANVAAVLSGQIGTVPYPHYAVAGTYPGRPVTARPVWWMSWDVAPPATSGTTSSGTGPVVGLDVVFLGVGVVPG